MPMITDISSSSMKVSHKYDYPKYLTQSFSMGEATPPAVEEESPHIDKKYNEEVLETQSMEIPEELPEETVDDGAADVAESKAEDLDRRGKQLPGT